MGSNQSSWEGYLLIFAGVFTALLGASYILSWSFHQPTPWPLIPLIALIVTLCVRFLRRHRA